MGRILSVREKLEIIFDPESDLGDLIERYIGNDAREMYDEIIEEYNSRIELIEEDIKDKSFDASVRADTIDNARYDIGRVLDDLNDEDHLIDKKELIRNLRNIHWELSY